MLGPLIDSIKKEETDAELLSMMDGLNAWRKKRNQAIHELVKIEEGQPHKHWEERLSELAVTSREGYEILKQIYYRVAVLNPRSRRLIFPLPKTVAT